MIIDLRKIVQKATKEHGLTMEKEKRIVENLGRSEEWFVETFAQLKRICGQALHQIDFKDYQQLHSVIKSARECDYLLNTKNCKPQVLENLVGAAKNLYLSLQGAKWLFEIKTLLDKSNGIKELAQLLSLYYRAQDLQIDLNSVEQSELFEESDPITLQNLQVVSEFIKLSKVAVDFDSLFGSHQKVIETLEKYEKEKSLPKLIEKVEALQEQLQFQNQSQSNPEIKTEPNKGCAISTLAEQEVLQKVRSYISLNQDYQNYILKQEVLVEQVKEEQNIVSDNEDKKLFDETNQKQDDLDQHKISYQKALRLQRQARASNIPDDIPVLKRLNQSILGFEKFKKKCSDYFKFRDKIKSKGATMLSQTLIQQSVQSQNQKKNEKPQQSLGLIKNIDQEFSVSFVKDLINESIKLEIEIPKEIFQKEKIFSDLQIYQNWKETAVNVLTDLDKELQPKNFRAEVPIESMEVDFESNPLPKPKLVSSEVLQKFIEVKDQIKELPVYDSDLFLKIQAFDWLLNAKNLVEHGSKSLDGKFVFSLQYWENMLKQHELFIKTLPILKDHPILQKIIWEIERARQVVEFVSKQKHAIKSNQGKFLDDKYQNYVAFRTKCSAKKIENLISLAEKTKVDITEEMALLNEWLQTYNKHQEMVKNKTLFEKNNYEQVKLIQKHIYLSPIEYGDLYFTISKRLEIAQQIRQDIKNIIEDQAFKNQKQGKKARIKYSRVEKDLNHFEKNCQIPGIQEVEKIQNQVKLSRQKIAEAHELLQKCANVLPCDQIKLRDQARKIGLTFEIDMEEEEQSLVKDSFKISFDLWTKGHQKLDVEQIKLLDKDFKKVEESLKKQDPEIAENYSQIKQDVIKCIRIIKRCTEKAELEELLKIKIGKICPNVCFEQQTTDKLAEIYLKQKQGNFKQVCKNVGGTINVADFEEQRKQNKKKGSDSNSDSGSDSQSKSSSSESSSKSEESSEEVIVFKKNAQGQVVKVSSKDKASSSSSASDESSNESSEVSDSDESEEASEIVEEIESQNESSQGEEGESEQEEMHEQQKEENAENLIAGRKRRQIKSNKMDDHIYYDEARKQREQERLEAKFNSLTEEQKQFLDEQLKKREQKKKEKADAKLAAQQFEAERQRQQKIRDQRKIDEENPSENLGLGQDQTLMQSILSIRERTRKQSQETLIASIKRLDEHLLSQPEPVALFEITQGVSKEEIINHFMKDMESKLVEKYPQIDANYRRKINDLCLNIKQIYSYPEIAELFFVKKSLNCFSDKGKGEVKSQIKFLFQSHLFFKDHLVQLQRQRDEKKPKRVINTEQGKPKVNFEVAKSETQKKVENQEIDPNEKTQQSFEEHISTSKRRSDYVSGESSGENGGGINTSARFSDDEQAQPSYSLQPQLAQKQISTLSAYLNSNQFEDSSLKQMYVPHQMYKYNPFLVISVQSRAQATSIDQKKGVQLPLHLQDQLNDQAPQSEPILYDPIKQVVSQISQTTDTLNVPFKNMARPGSLLKVWEGSLQPGTVGSECKFNVQFFSIGDIKGFQNLPDLPNTFTLKGKSKLQEVMSHFLKLRQEIQLAKLKKTHPSQHFLLKGWVTRKNRGNQENSDKYTNHFDSLEQTQRCSVFTLFKGVNLYMVPIIAETKLFCKQMGVVPLKLQHNAAVKKHFVLGEEETEYFAFFSHLKSTFNKKLSFLNPTVLSHLDDIQKVETRPIVQQQTSTTRNQEMIYQQPVIVNLIQPAYPQIKNEQEEMYRDINMYEPEDEDERELDDLISMFRSQGITNIEDIQRKLMPIIEKFSGTGRKEEKLEAFLKEVIEKINAQQTQVQQPIRQQPQVYNQTSFTQPTQAYAGSQQYYQQPYMQQPYAGTTGYAQPYFNQQQYNAQYGQYYTNNPEGYHNTLYNQQGYFQPGPQNQGQPPK